MKNKNTLLSICGVVGLFLACEVNSAQAATYYLSPTGSDTSGTGSSTSPWFTLNKAWGVARGGDVIYLRGGTYRYSSQQSLHNKSGSAGNTIKIWAYPGEKPIISPTSTFSATRGIDIWQANYLHFKGLEIAGFVQKTSTSFFYGIAAQNSSFNTFEELNVHDNGFGLSIGMNSGDNLILNSDFHRNSDPLTTVDGNRPWGGADGITIRTSDPSRTNIIRGCRMWWNSDDGVDLFNNEGTIIIENSWAFWNGYQPGTFTVAGDGNGLKIGPTATDQSMMIRKILRNNLVFQNRMRGVDQNNNRSITLLYNNTSYKNGYSGDPARGFDFWNGTAATIARNNVDFGEAMGCRFNSQAILSHNTFRADATLDSNYSVSASDFVSLDSTGVIGPRQSDGSLPNVNFLKLAQGSDLINRGTGVGLPFYGSAPDLGAFESNYGATPAPSDTTLPVISGFTVPTSTTSLSVPISVLTASDNVGVTGYLVNESSTKPSATSSGWTTSRPTAYQAASAGTKVLYAWARDAAGNVSTGVSRTVVISLAPAPSPTPSPTPTSTLDTTVPVVTSFSVPSSSSSFTFPVTAFTATDNVRVTAYMINEGSTKPLLTNVRWQATPPTSYTALSEGTKVLYAWARDAAGNVSASLSRSVVVKLSTPVPSPTPTPSPTATPSPSPTATSTPTPTPTATSTPTYSQTYYIAPTGSDAASGSSTSPWRTLAYACTRATAPSTLIRVRAGTYSETARCNLLPGVSIQGDGAASTIIRTTYAATSSSDGAIRLNSSTHTNGNQSISGITLDGSNLTSYRAIAVNYRNNVSIHHTKIVNFLANASFFRGSTAAWDVEPPVYATGNQFYNNEVINCGTRKASESAHIRINGQKDMLVYNNSFDQTSRPAGENGNILGGEWNKALKIYNNTFTKNSDEGPEWNFFTELWHWEGGGEIYGNTFRGAATMDIVDVTPSTYGYGLKIYNNKYLSATPVPWAAHGVQAINIELRVFAVGVYIFGNHFKNFPNGVWVDAVVNEGEGYTYNKLSDIHVYENLFENIGSLNGGGEAIWMNSYGSNPNITWDNIYIYSNTMTGGSTTTWGNGIKWSAGGKSNNILIRKNIIHGFKTRPVNFGVGIAGATVNNLVNEYNLYYLNGTNSANYGTGTMTNRTDRNNLVGNPYFVNPIGGNYAPTAGTLACYSSSSGSYLGAFPCQ